MVRMAKEHSTFSYMKKSADKIVPPSDQPWDGGIALFIANDTHCCWREEGPDEILKGGSK